MTNGTAPRSAGAGRELLGRSLHTARRLIVDTVLACFRYRVTGLAGEAAFFAILSLPPLIFAGVGLLGYIASWFHPGAIADFREELLELASRVLTDPAVDTVIAPTITDVLGRGRADVISIGFLISLWSGSRALNVFIDTIGVMYGHQGHRHAVRARVLSFLLYLAFLIGAIVLVPLVLAGPGLVDRVLPDQLSWLGSLYWPIVLLGSGFFLATLYDLSLPKKYRLRGGLAGALLALLIWVGGSYVLRLVLSRSTSSSSIYGPLSAPIALMLWLYVISMAILIGAALNSSIFRFRHPETPDQPSRLESRDASP